MSANAKDDVSRTLEGTPRSRAIGAILVDAGRLTEADVGEIQAYAESTGLLFGEAGIKLNRFTAEDVNFALARQFHYPVLTHGTGGMVADEVVAAYEPQSELAEDLRTVRSRLVIDWLSHAERNILTVVSPDRADGRSWFAANLATVFAQAGERTLLIDADMRAPRQHQLFNLNDSLGLSAVLTGRAGKETARRIHPELRLFVVPAGVLPPNPQELLTRPVFEVVISRFASQFDVVIIDTPPARHTADAQIVAARAGAAIMLSRRNHTGEVPLQSTLKSLLDSRVKVVGSVINDYD
jgi:chain length determinant protein tyrosine kinase EpsG